MAAHLASISALEPPAPVSARFRSPAAARRWYVRRWQEVPSWLASMVVHLATFILLASLVSHATQQPPRHLLVVWSAAPDSLADDTRPSRAQQPAELRIESSPALASAPRPTAPGPDQMAETEPEPAPPEEADLAQPAEQSPAEVNQFAERAEEEARDDAQEDPVTLPDYPLTPAQLAALAPTRDASGQLVQANADQRSRTARPAVLDPRLASDSAQDYIVDRFIEYDIGRLRGAEGTIARRQFDALGPEAIPALVRGLNKSAGIRASCPVGVISRKLQTAMSQTRDPAMIDYALDNLGRDLPAGAPHAARVRALRDQFLDTYVDGLFTADVARLREAPRDSRSEWDAQVRTLYNGSLGDLVRSLQSRDPRARSAACAVLSMKQHPDLTVRQRLQLARLLIAQFRGSTIRSRARLDQALESLTKGTSFAPPPQRDARQRDELMQQWQQWWSQYELIVREDSASAAG